MSQGFNIKDYYAIPFPKRGYIIIHKGSQMEKVCRTESSARKYIAELMTLEKPAQTSKTKSKKAV